MTGAPPSEAAAVSPCSFHTVGTETTMRRRGKPERVEQRAELREAARADVDRVGTRRSGDENLFDGHGMPDGMRPKRGW